MKTTLTDTEILDRLQKYAGRKGKHTGIIFSDSRDMGYGKRDGFLTCWSRCNEFEGKGNSVREALTNALLKRAFVPPPVKPRK